MGGSNLPVTSREYKLLLNVERFKNRDEGSQMFLSLVEFFVTKEGGTIVEKQNKEEKRRTSYLDTEELALHQRGFVLRLREEAKTPPEFQINFKYRSADRYLSAAQDVSSTQSATVKFEEDILLSFVSKFSHSSSIKTNAPPDLSNLSRLASVFPAVNRLELQGDAAIKTVKGFKATEVVRKLCKFQFVKPPVLKASLSFWYLTKEEIGWPLVAEFSFDYDTDEDPEADALEKFPSQVVEGANRFFAALQAQAGWVSPNSMSKTAFAMEVL